MDIKDEVPIPDIWCENSRSELYPKSIVTYLNEKMGPHYEIAKHFKIGKLLGRGSFGSVYKVQNIKTNEKHAMKIAEKITSVYCVGPVPCFNPFANMFGQLAANNPVECITLNGVENIRSSFEQRQRVTEREISLLRVCSHKNIIQLLDVIETPKMVYILLELCNQSLATILEQLHKLSEEEVRNVTRQISDALVYLHASEIAHRDLKTSNVLCKTAKGLGDSFLWEVKLSDFGLAACRGQPGTPNLFTCSCGTPTYMAPEVLFNDPYDQKCDIFSLGVIMFVGLMGEEPFPGKNALEVQRRHLCSKVTLAGPEWAALSPAVRYIVKKLLTYDPLSRFSAAQLYRHPWTLGRKYIPESSIQPKPRRRHKLPNSSFNVVSALKECIESMTSEELPFPPLDF